MGFGKFENGFTLFGVPEINGAILASSCKSLEVNGSNSIDCVVMTLEDYFCLFFCFPADHLSIEA